jgi:hypothetical protein
MDISERAIIGAGCHVRPKRRDTWAVVPNLWGGIVGRPSTLKSPSLKEVMKPLKRLEEKARVVFENEKRAHHLQIERFQVCKEAIKKKMAKAAYVGNTLQMDMAKHELEVLKEPAPVWKRSYTNDATIEKIHELLSMNTRGCCCIEMSLTVFWIPGTRKVTRLTEHFIWRPGTGMTPKRPTV